MSNDPPPILIAAFGNEMAADDAFGHLVAEVLRVEAPPELDILSLGMKPASLFDHLADRRALCVIDAAHADDLPPGTLLEIDFFAPNRPRLAHDTALSTHGLSVADELELAKQLGLCPEQVRLVAVIADSVEIGRPPSEPVLQQVPAAVERIVAWANMLLQK